MIARAINPSVFGVLFNNWALVLAILLTTLAISGLTGWLLVRYSALPGATGAWGSSPGGASAMVVMAQEYGADVRLVALMSICGCCLSSARRRWWCALCPGQ